MRGFVNVFLDNPDRPKQAQRLGHAALFSDKAPSMMALRQPDVEKVLLAAGAFAQKVAELDAQRT